MTDNLRFGYPISATANNWLHDCLFDAIHTIHAIVDFGDPYPLWPLVLPENVRKDLSPKHGLKNRLYKYYESICRLAKPERDTILLALEEENKIDELLSGICDCKRINDLPLEVREPIRELFKFAFGLLTALGIRDQQYREIYAVIQYKLCPFCGLEDFDSPIGAAP